MARVLCLDFDETIVEGDVTRALLERFAGREWHDLEAAHARGEMSVEEFHVAAFALVAAAREELSDFAREAAQPRAGVRELVDWCAGHGWMPVVVSNGFDLAVNAAMDAIGLDRVARHAGRTRFAYRWRVSYESPRGVEVRDGFQLSYVSAFRSAGDVVAIVGAACTSMDACRAADGVFARDGLFAKLDRSRPELFRWETFRDLVTVLSAQPAGWLAAP